MSYTCGHLATVSGNHSQSASGRLLHFKDAGFKDSTERPGATPGPFGDSFRAFTKLYPPGVRLFWRIFMRKLLLASAATMGALLATAGGAMAQPVKPVEPGTIVVHLNGYFQFEVAGYGSTFNNVAGNKLNPISANGDVRIYPGFDAETLTNIAYGVQVETRVTTSNASKGVGNNSTSTSGTSSVYIRRAYGYIGTPYAGFARFGQTDSVFSLLQDGDIEAFGDGGQFNDDGGPQQILPSGAVPANPIVYADQGALYSTDKVVYLTPSIGGLSGGIGYEPNSNGIREGYANCATASSTCAALAASTTPGDIGSRRKNTVDAMVQYAIKANGFVTKVSGGYIHGAPIAYDGPVQTSGALKYGYDDLSVYQAGAQTTFAGLTLGANIKAGQVEDGYVFKPKGARDALGYIVGGTYVIGPYVIGASYFNEQTAGSYVPGAKEAKTLSEYGAAVGGNYVIGKDLSFFVQYLYDHRHQPGNTALSATGNAQAQLISGGATFKW